MKAKEERKRKNGKKKGRADPRGEEGSATLLECFFLQPRIKSNYPSERTASKIGIYIRIYIYICLVHGISTGIKFYAQ